MLIGVIALLLSGILIMTMAIYENANSQKELQLVLERSQVQEEIDDKVQYEQNAMLIPLSATEQLQINEDKRKTIEKTAIVKKSELAEKVIQEDKNEPEEKANTEEKNNIKDKESLLKGKIISIDAGHQKKGNNKQEPIAPGSSKTKAKVSSGTRGVATKKYEYELNLEVALKLQKALEAKGAKVYMSRSSHDVDISNAERAELANSVNADLSLRIHADGSENPKVNGFSVLIPGEAYVKPEIVKTSKAMAVYLEKSLKNSIPNASKGIITRNDLTGFNWSKVPAVLIEMGFMSNPEEDKRMSTEAFQQDFVNAVVAGLENYYKDKNTKIKGKS